MAGVQSPVNIISRSLVLLAFCQAALVAEAPSMPKMDEATRKDWLAKWEKSIDEEYKNRTCDKELGEEIGWLMTPPMNGFCYGYLATGDTKYIDMLVDWTDSLNKRSVKEPDGFSGWPKLQAAGTDVD